MSASVPHSDRGQRPDMGPSGFPIGTRVQRARPWPGWVLFVLGVGAFAMAAAAAAGAVAVISGTLEGKWYDVRDLGFAMQRLGSELRGDGGSQRNAIAYVVTALIGGAGILTFVGASLLTLVWVERRLLARFQVRRGPNRVGPFGLLQPVADALKLLQK